MTSKQKINYYIGIDASTSCTGFAVMNDNWEIIEKGKIEAKANDPAAFDFLYNELKELFNKYKPKFILCEEQFMGGNVRTTIKLVRPTGVVLAAAGTLKHDFGFDFIMPLSWRKIYHKDTEWEKKNKKEHSFEVTKFRYPNSVENFKKENDIADAIGIAYTAVILGKEYENQ